MSKQLSTIIDTISGAKNELASYAEQVIDLAVDNELWENVPIVEHATKLLNIHDIYKKNKLKRNYAAFIEAVGKMDEEEIASFSKILFSNDDVAEETAETIFEIIVESEKPLKARLIGRLSLALAKQELGLKEYNTIALIIQSSSIAALMALPLFLASNNNSCHKSGIGSIPEEGLLFSLGIAKRHGNMFRIDETGQLLAIHGYGIEAST